MQNCSGAAGLVEEFVLLALPIALAVAADWSAAVTLVLLIVMRSGIRIYLGWHALFVVPWIAAALALWRWCPLVWPFVIGHGIYDVLQLLSATGSGGAFGADRVLNLLTIAVPAIVLRCAAAPLKRRVTGAEPDAGPRGVNRG